MSSPKRLAIVVNKNKEGSEQLAKELVSESKQLGLDTIVSTQFPIPVETLKGADLCLAIGGDGTLLSVVESARLNQTPVLGINLGRLGFMANYSPQEIKDELKSIIAGNYKASPRSLIKITNSQGKTHHCLNDLVLKATGSKLIRIKVSCNSNELNTYSADGIIVSTPTGSTAYNLSAGGPIIHPDTTVLVVTPINPHTLSNRAIVLDQKHEISIDCLDGNQSVTLSADGVDLFPDETNFPLTLKVDPSSKFVLIQKTDASYHSILKKKLRWNGDSLSEQADK